jgi:diadenosine tetraphosphate (Ap4A) HIT family hydrolase
MKPCRFCNLSATDIVIANELAVVSRDSYPVSPGHTLVIPKRHVGSFFATTKEERLALLELIDQAKLALDSEFHPAAYNLGLNDGPAAGQSIPHVHFHLIPRYEGDRTDARGGVRWVLPEKARYWK